MSETILAQKNIGDLVAEHPARARVFERWGIDYCCGGKHTLALACAAKTAPLQSLLEELTQSDAQSATTEEAQTDWRNAPLGDLIDHIVLTHHNYLKNELPRLSMLTEKVRDAHGAKHPELEEVARVYASLRCELELHMQKEEKILFPMIRTREQGNARHASVAAPIQVMETEHEQAGAALERLRELTANYTLPKNGCNTYRAMLDGLREFEADMHRHVHKENHLLFPRAAEQEEALRPDAPETQIKKVR